MSTPTPSGWRCRGQASRKSRASSLSTRFPAAAAAAAATSTRWVRGKRWKAKRPRWDGQRGAERARSRRALHGRSRYHRPWPITAVATSPPPRFSSSSLTTSIRRQATSCLRTEPSRTHAPQSEPPAAPVPAALLSWREPPTIKVILTGPLRRAGAATSSTPKTFRACSPQPSSSPFTTRRARRCTAPCAGEGKKGLAAACWLPQVKPRWPRCPPENSRSHWPPPRLQCSRPVTARAD